MNVSSNNLSGDIPKDVRRMVSDLSKRREFFELVGKGGGKIDFEGRTFTVKPAFNGRARRVNEGLEKAMATARGLA